MPAKQEPNLGLNFGWISGESGWASGMDANLKRLGAVVGLSVSDRDLSAPPTSPVNGDRYLIPAGATGEWAGRTDQVAVRIDNIWNYHMPNIGWLCYVEDEALLSVYKASGWSAGISI